MRKINFLVGALSGLVGGLLLTNKQLRDRLKEAEDPADAAKILGQEMQKSGKQVAKEAKEWFAREDVQDRWTLMKKYVKQKAEDAASEAKIIASDATRKAKKELPVVARKAKKQARKTYKSAKKSIEEKWG